MQQRQVLTVENGQNTEDATGAVLGQDCRHARGCADGPGGAENCGGAAVAVVDKIVDLRVVTQRQILMVQKVQKKIEILHVQHRDKVVDVLVVQVSQVYVVERTVEIPQIQIVEEKLRSPTYRQSMYPDFRELGQCTCPPSGSG